MLHAKIIGLLAPTKKFFLKVFTIYGHGGHLGHVPWIIYIYFVLTVPGGSTCNLALIG